MKRLVIVLGAAGGALLLAWVAVALNGCASARQRESEREALATAEQRGRDIFLGNCQRCHPGGDEMVGPSLKHWYVSGWGIRYRVRHGGAPMPAFSEKVINAGQMADLVAYVKSLRHEPATPSPDTQETK